MIGAALANIVLSLVLTPEFGVEGPALAVTISFALAFVPMLRIALEATSVRLGDLVRRAFAPAYGLGALLAAVLLAARELFEPDTAPVVLALSLAGVLAYWAACYLVWFDEDERALLRGLVRR
jgi:O-antigen/teichoic acid export membrane protein